MTSSKTKTKPKTYINHQNPIEALRDIGSSAVQSVKQDLASRVPKDFLDQFLSSPEPQKTLSKSGELYEGEKLDLKQTQEQTQKADIEPGIDYRREILHGEKRIAQEDLHTVNAQIQEIIVELKRIVASSKELEIEFKEVVVEQRVVNPGKYHVNFFEWALAIIKQARMKIEDSGAWLTVMKSKKSKQGYWNMFKKHGTTFGLSNERVVATQTG